jgi:hypothetical protein
MCLILLIWLFLKFENEFSTDALLWFHLLVLKSLPHSRQCTFISPTSFLSQVFRYHAWSAKDNLANSLLSFFSPSTNLAKIGARIKKDLKRGSSPALTLDKAGDRVVIPGIRRPFGGHTGRVGGRPYPLRLIWTRRGTIDREIIVPNLLYRSNFSYCCPPTWRLIVWSGCPGKRTGSEPEQ